MRTDSFTVIIAQIYRDCKDFKNIFWLLTKYECGSIIIVSLLTIESEEALMQNKPLAEEFVDGIAKRRQNENYNAMMRIADAAKLYGDRMRRLTEGEIPSGYRLLLFHLARAKEGITQLELAETAHLKPPTVSVALRKMEDDGLVIRKQDKKDLRRTFVFLSEKGKRLNELVRNAHIEGDEIALSGLTDDEIRVLSDLLNKVIDNLIDDRKNGGN